jgi:hypothetical protein
MFYVPSVGDDPATLVPELECSWSKHLVNDEWPLPRGRKLVPILVSPNSSEHQVSDLELAAAHVALVVAPHGLLVPS